MKKPDAADIKAFRDKEQCGVFEAHARLMKTYVQAELVEIKRSNEPPNSKITRLIDLMLYALEEEGPRG